MRVKSEGKVSTRLFNLCSHWLTDWLINEIIIHVCKKHQWLNGWMIHSFINLSLDPSIRSFRLTINLFNILFLYSYSRVFIIRFPSSTDTKLQGQAVVCMGSLTKKSFTIHRNSRGYRLSRSKACGGVWGIVKSMSVSLHCPNCFTEYDEEDGGSMLLVLGEWPLLCFNCLFVSQLVSKLVFLAHSATRG